MQYLRWGVTFRRLVKSFFREGIPLHNTYSRGVGPYDWTLKRCTTFKHLVHDASSRSNRATWDENMDGFEGWQKWIVFIKMLSSGDVNESHWPWLHGWNSQHSSHLLLETNDVLTKTMATPFMTLEGGPPRATKTPLLHLRQLHRQQTRRVARGPE